MFLRNLAVAAVVVLCCEVLGAQDQPATPAGGQAAANAYTTNPQFKEAMRQGKLLLNQQKVAFARDEFNKANKIAGGSCWECLDGVYETQFAEGDFKAAIRTAVKLEEIAPNPLERSLAQLERGNALLTKAGDKAKPDQLQEAYEAFQQAVATYPKNLPAMFLEGKTLARMGKMDEAKACFSECASMAKPTDPARLRAQHFAEDPILSTRKQAPAFEITALDGTRFNLDAMNGRVVLIDFWATWCGPCNEALPEVKKIAKEFAGEPLVILSVSWDSDDAKWRQFIQKNEMTWMQYRDADQKLSHEFGVTAIPHYFTIDSDGVLTSELVGSDSNVEGRIKKLVAKAREAQKQRVEAASAAGGR